MGYTNSSLVDCTMKSPNHSGTRTQKIDRITPHCVVGQLTAEGIGTCFADSKVQASCNYGIGTEGRVCLIVDEKNRSWCSSSSANDQRAITIECASDTYSPYAFNWTVYNKLVVLCADICKRNGHKKLLWISDKTTALNYVPQSGECILTVHRWFANKPCPGDWMYSRMGQLAIDVNKLLSATTTTTATKPTTTAATTTTKPIIDTKSGIEVNYLVKVIVDDLNYRNAPGTEGTTIMGQLKKNCKYTIVRERWINGMRWGFLKSGAGWVSCHPEFVERCK